MDELKSIASFLNVKNTKLKIAGTEEKRVLSLAVNGKEVRGLIAVAKQIARSATRVELLGVTPEDEAMVNQWMEYRVAHIDKCTNEKEIHSMLKELNGYLGNRVYLVGHWLSLADILLYRGLHPVFDELTFYDKQQYMHVSRWIDQVQHTPGLRQNLAKIIFQKTPIYPSMGVVH